MIRIAVCSLDNQLDGIVMDHMPLNSRLEKYHCLVIYGNGYSNMLRNGQASVPSKENSFFVIIFLNRDISFYIIPITLKSLLVIIHNLEGKVCRT